MAMSKNLFTLCIVVFLAWVINDSLAQEETQTAVTITPTFVRVQSSSTFILDVRVDDVVKLFAASVTLAFDSTILRYKNVTGGSFLTNNNSNSVFLGVIVQPPLPMIPNRITVDQAIPGGGTVSGSGILFTVKFSTLRSGLCPIDILSVDLRNETNTSILVQTISSEVAVNNPPSDVQLLSPPNRSKTDSTLNVKLIWTKSIDLDTIDLIHYRIHLKNKFSDTCFVNFSDTTITLTKNLLKENTEYTWYVDATDGLDTSLSLQSFKFTTPIITEIEWSPLSAPDMFTMEQNYPNPFNTLTIIRFSVPMATQVTVSIYDVIGHEFVQLMNHHLEPGRYSVTWNGKNSEGVAVGSGIYLYVLTAGWYREVKKMVLIK
jgi:hypothetical protein